jgi:Rrf2 family cysteine metabolism transcriptional repressor
MKISTRGRYGIRALLDLAMQWGKGPVRLKDIAQNQDISLQYLEHLMRPLITAGLVSSMRGARGGVWLAKPPDEIKLSGVLEVLIGSMSPVECVDDPKLCNRSKHCATRDIWYEMKKAVDVVLESVSLKDMAVRQNAKARQIEAIYSK